MGDEWEDRDTVKEFSEKLDEAFPEKGHQTPEAEQIRQLKRKNEQLWMERYIKKRWPFS